MTRILLSLVTLNMFAVRMREDALTLYFFDGDHHDEIVWDFMSYI